MLTFYFFIEICFVWYVIWSFQLFLIKWKQNIPATGSCTNHSYLRPRNYWSQASTLIWFLLYEDFPLLIIDEIYQLGLFPWDSLRILFEIQPSAASTSWWFAYNGLNRRSNHVLSSRSYWWSWARGSFVIQFWVQTGQESLTNKLIK